METQVMNRRQKKIELPQTEDIKILSNYVEKQVEDNWALLEKGFSEYAWRDLAEATLIYIQVFNRKRAGELERLLISDFKNKQSVPDDDEAYHKLSKSSQQVAKQYVRIEIRGKLNRVVPILLNLKMHDSIEVLLKYRRNMGISSKNPYVFGLPNCNSKRHRFLRATVLMRKFSKDCGAKKPFTLRGTFLRKHIATKCADMEMNETEISRVANFMGHHIDIHKNIYRQPVAKVDILSMSKVLEKAQEHESDSEPSIDNQQDSGLHSSENVHDTETSNVDDSIDISLEKKNDSSLISSSDNERVLKRKRSPRSKFKLQKSKKNNEVDTSTDSYQDSSLELSHSRKCKRLNDDKENSEIRKKIVKKRWTEKEIKSVGYYFSDYIENHILPSYLNLRNRIT